jgi:hypothetical protein
MDQEKLLFRVIDGVINKEYGDINNWAQPVLQFIKATTN